MNPLERNLLAQSMRGTMNPLETQLLAARTMHGLGDATSTLTQDQMDMLSSYASSPWRYVWTAAALASSAISAVHGYRRHRGSVGWAIGWGLCGAIAPVITPAIAYAEGFGKPIKKR